jgi:LmbE family N-acetylglucosaminyl deacetylase
MMSLKIRSIIGMLGVLGGVAVLTGLAQQAQQAQPAQPAQKQQLRVIAFGAHPDDCDGRAGGTAAKFAKAGALVKFVSVTNGDAGHQEMGGGRLAQRRYAETQESARRLGIAEYEVLPNHDGELTPSLEVRRQIIRAIRMWKADIVLAPRSNDYHPDHRYTGILVQDAAYLVVVPNIVSEAPALRRNPIFLYFQDGFQKPAPFQPDVVVNIDDVWDLKQSGMAAHVSQVKEWLPWVAAGNREGSPSAPEAAKKGASQKRGGGGGGGMSSVMRAALEKRYGAEQAKKIQHVEAFELCEYGRRASPEELDRLFPK